jgi:hypothetical protein
MEGVDYSFSKPNPARLAAAGKRFAMAYIGPGTDDKHFTVAEVAALHAVGIATVLLVEGTVGATGYDTGRLHAKQAVSMADARGFPTKALYFAVDRDVNAATWPGARDYLKGAASVVGVNAVGVYGERDAMVWAARDGVATWFFQTYGWSDYNHDGAVTGGEWYAGNHVEQYRNGVALAGGEVDLCRSMKADFGQWPLETPLQEGNVMAVIVAWPPEVKGSLCFSNGDSLRHIPGPAELDQIKRGWPGIQTVDATKWPAQVVHQLYGPDGPPWGTDPGPVPLPGEAEIEAIAKRVAQEEIAATVLTPARPQN